MYEPFPRPDGKPAPPSPMELEAEGQGFMDLMAQHAALTGKS